MCPFSKSLGSIKRGLIIVTMVCATCAYALIIIVTVTTPATSTAIESFLERLTKAGATRSPMTALSTD